MVKFWRRRKKKVSSVPSNKKGKTSPRTPEGTSPTSNAKKSGSFVSSINCSGENHNDDSAMMTSDMVKNHQSAPKATSMLTPDMLETLGIMEVVEERQYRSSEKQKQKLKPKQMQKRDKDKVAITNPIRSPTAAAMVSTSSRRDRTTRTSRERRNSSKNKNRYYGHSDTASSLYFGDNETATLSTSSTCSSSEDTYEPIPSDPCWDWNFADDNEAVNDNDIDNDNDTQTDNNSHVQYYQDSTVADCDTINCASMVLSMPVACGLVFVDNILDTKYFDTAAKSYQKIPSASHKPEIVVHKSKRSSYSRKKQKTDQRNSREQHNGSNDDYASNVFWECKLFPSPLGQQEQGKKIIAL